MSQLRPASRRPRLPKPTRRRALELLAASPRGLTEAIPLANGIPVELLVELVRAGLATATTEQIAMGRKTIEVARVTITEAGRNTLAEI
jgi:hypothetical protein